MTAVGLASSDPDKKPEAQDTATPAPHSGHGGIEFVVESTYIPTSEPPQVPEPVPAQGEPAAELTATRPSQKFLVKLPNEIRVTPLEKGLLYAIGLLLAVLLLSIASHRPAPPERDDFLIVPAQRIGLLRLGITSDEAKRLIREAHGVVPLEDVRPRATVLDWPQLELSASFLDGKAINLVTKSPRWQMQNGIRVGSTFQETVQKLGQPLDYIEDREGALGAWRGLEVEFSNGRITAIAVCCD